MRMYILLYHGGGVTGLTQVNDLWLHWMMEVILGEMETLDVDAHMALRPGKIYTPTRQSIINNACTMWKTEVDHRRSIQWTLRTGASMSLDSDAETTQRTLSRQLHVFWEELDMPTKRREAIQAIDDDIAAGRLSDWEDVKDIIEPFPRGDHLLEGQEIEPAAGDQEIFWNDDSSVSSMPSGDDDDDDDDGGGGGGARTSGGSGPTAFGTAGLACVPTPW